MSASFTQTATFNRSHARRVATKMAADLHRMQRLYDWPDDATINDLIEEVTEMLALDYLKTLEIGFERDGKRILSLQYVSRRDGTLSQDDNAGGVPRGVDVSGCDRINYMTYTESFLALSAAERLAVKQTLPYVRTAADEAVDGPGYWEQTRSYSVNGSGTVRHTFRPLS
ncbi:MAG: hypothetical protein M3320_00155 [Actinomycetota bacterium]|nr:hypothetical protein [Actinomycetota bacterium]MDQ5807068.1 hypothetical protein [Actinomycetota bacterium]